MWTFLQKWNASVQVRWPHKDLWKLCRGMQKQKRRSWNTCESSRMSLPKSRLTPCQNRNHGTMPLSWSLGQNPPTARSTCCHPESRWNSTPSSRKISTLEGSACQNHPWHLWSSSSRRRTAHFVGAHMHICIYAQSQSKYISVFSLILFLYYFHFTVRTLFQFFLKFSLFFLPFYSLQKPVTLTWYCWFCFRLSARVPARRAESNHIIRNAHAHLGMLSRVEVGGGNKVYAGWDTHLHFPPQCSDSHWGVSVSQILKFLIPTVPISTI